MTTAAPPIECLCAGNIVVDHLCAPLARMPKPGELVVCDELPLAIGGLAANVSVGLARLGVRTALSGRIGNDILGTYAANILADAGVDTRHLIRSDRVGTSGTLIINVRGEDRRYIHTRGGSDEYAVEDVPDDMLARCKVLYLGGMLLLNRMSEPGALAGLFRRARELGAKTVVDVVVPGSDATSDVDYRPLFEEVLPWTDVFLPNTDEAAIITRLRDPIEQAEWFRAAGAGVVAITLGEQGSVMLAGGIRVRAGVYPTTFVGSTGAGDAFDAGFIAGMLSGENSLGCLRWGSALGASCVRSLGGTESLFDRAELLEFLANHDLPLNDLAE